MRITLISTPTRTQVPNYIVPTGIISLAAYLLELGHEVSVIDAAALREPNDSIIARIRETRPDLIGIGGIITAYGYIIDLSRDIKFALPSTPIVLGGQIVINNVENCFKHMAIDYVVHGYGEMALGKIADHLEGKLEISSIPGLSFVDGDTILTTPGREYFRNLDDMPLPAYHLIDMEHYATINGHRHAKLQKYLDQTGKTAINHRFCTVMGTLGCTDRCTFCVHEQEFVGLKVFSNEYLLNHIRHLHENYGINVFAIGEEMFITKLERAREFNALMKENFPNVYWSASTRADFVTPEMIEELKTGNCFYLAWGFESGSQRMLDAMKKRMSREQNMQAYTVTDNSPLVAACSLMIGNVGEDNNSIKESIDAIHTAKIGRSAVFFASAYPGGRTWDWAVQRGIISDTHDYLLKASDNDAASRINVNLTPYPDWILKAWQALVTWACEKNEHGKAVRLHANLPLKQRLYKLYKGVFAFGVIPILLLRPFVDLYFAYYRLRRKFFKTARDKRHEYKVDKKGAILPENLIVNMPQRHLSDEKRQDVLKKGLIVDPLAGRTASAEIAERLRNMAEDRAAVG